MKKVFSYILIISFLSLNNLTFVFADNQNITLQTEKTNTTNVLDKIEDKVQDLLEKAETKITDTE